MKARGARTAAQASGAAAEEAAARFLVGKGLAILARNYRTRFGEIDLVARDGDMLVFVEVRRRCGARYGGAAASVDWRKRMRLEAAARHFLARLQREPACRFDVVTLEDHGVSQWLRGAFEVA